jgi:hypothetical protein
MAAMFAAAERFRSARSAAMSRPPVSRAARTAHGRICRTSVITPGVALQTAPPPQRERRGGAVTIDQTVEQTINFTVLEKRHRRRAEMGRTTHSERILLRHLEPSLYWVGR